MLALPEKKGFGVTQKASGKSRSANKESQDEGMRPNSDMVGKELWEDNIGIMAGLGRKYKTQKM